MILEKDFKEQDNQIVGQADERIEMGVDTENINHLMMIMSSNLYQNPIGSIVREYTSNAIDANVEAKCNEPVLVKLLRDRVGNYTFEVQDFGPGLDDKDFRTVISKYGKSTKRDSNDQLGFFGLGCKSAFSYTSSFNYTCVKGGKKRKYLLYKAETGFTIDLIHEEDTTERTGVTVTIPVKNWDFSQFRREIANQLAYFDNVYFMIENEDMNKGYTLFQSDDFQWSSMYGGGEMHITLGRVNYPISWSALNINKLFIPIGLKFGLDSGIFPIPNRENLIWNDNTKKIVLEKIRKVAKWFVEKYNKAVTEMPSLAKAWNHINTPQHYVTLENKTFDITELVTHSGMAFKDPIIKGIELQTPTFYKTRLDNMISDYRIVASYWSGRMHTKNVGYSLYNLMRGTDKYMLLDDNVVINGFFREFLKTTGATYFVKHKIDIDKKDTKYYEQLLHLNGKPTDEWKKYIAEYKSVQEGFIKEVFVDGTKLHDSDEFKKFWEDSKSKHKSIAKKKAVQTKTREDVSISYSRPRHGGGFMFERKVFKLDEIHKNSFVTIYLDETEAQEINDMARTFAQKRVRFARVGPIDLKKITKLNLHNFMTLAQLKRTKIFSQLVTGIRAKQLCDTYDVLMGNKIDIVKACVGKFSELAREVKAYSAKNLDPSIDLKNNAYITSLLTVAETGNLWDPTFVHKLKQFEKGLEDFDFIPKLAAPKFNDPVSVEQEYSKLIHNLLLFKKMRYENKLENVELCVKNSVPLDETKLINTPTAQVAV